MITCNAWPGGRNLSATVALVLFVLVPWSRASAADAPSRVALADSIPAAPVTDARAVVGLSRGHLVVLPPDGPATVLNLAERNGTWRAIDRPAGLPLPTAVIPAAEGFVCLGSTEGRGVAHQVEFVGGALRAVPLPDLPRSLSGMSGVELDGRVYLFGLDTAARPPRNVLLRIARATPGAAWEELAEFTGPARSGAAVSASFGMIHVMAGRSVDATGASGGLQTDNWVYRPRPVDGTTLTGWLRRADLPLALDAVAAARSGQAHTLVIGHEAAAESSSPDADRRVVLAYHAVTDSWAQLQTLPPRSQFPRQLLKSSAASFTLVSADGAGFGLEALTLNRTVRSLHLLDYLTIAAYFAGMAAIGVYFARRQSSTDEFSLGNRSVKWWASAFSMYATGTSAISLMAIPVMGFTSSLVWFVPVLMMLPLAWVQGNLIFPLLRRLEITSTYEYLERRFHPSLRVLASLQCILLQTVGRMGVVLLLPALAISATTGLNVYLSIVVMGVLTTIYTAVGGFEAVVWTDVVQGVLMFFGPILIILYALNGVAGGLGEVWRVGVMENKFQLALLSWDWTLPVLWIVILGQILNVTAFAGDQPMVQRVFATPLRDVRRMQYLMASLGVLIAALVTTVGLALYFFFRSNPARMDPMMNNDQIVPLFLVEVLPVGLAGILVSAIFAASMSTMSSIMNSVATLISEDFYKRLFPASPDARRLRLMKLLSYGVGAVGIAIALYMATFEVRSMFETWSRIAALLGGGFVGVYTLGMFTTRANTIGAICGAMASVVWTVFAERFTPVHWTMLAPSATLACIVVGYVVSLLTPHRGKSLEGLTVFTMKATPTVAAEEPEQAVGV